MPNDFFEDDDYYTGPPIAQDLIRRAEASLEVRLPVRYLELLSERNGGTPVRRCYPTGFETSWAPDHFEISGVLGVGGDRSIDSTIGLGSADLVQEWGYPDIGVVICDTPSGGHDTVMLDYRACGPRGEPSVVYVDEDRVPQEIASSFEVFVAQLTECPQGA
ncbi:SMI1/KNR4 family protein [Knoellia sp. LjRoot47]|uniref:SMI1/KNR4 family protein n=1 Tax=Knoellia sp. LjRoot47 TaxID=3342330 RepID=UPI003ECEADA3